MENEATAHKTASSLRPGRNNFCPHCPARYVWYYDLSKHLRKKHPQQRKQPIRQQPIRWPSNLLKHLRQAQENQHLQQNADQSAAVPQNEQPKMRRYRGQTKQGQHQMAHQIQGHRQFRWAQHNPQQIILSQFGQQIQQQKNNNDQNRQIPQNCGTISPNMQNQKQQQISQIGQIDVLQSSQEQQIGKSRKNAQNEGINQQIEFIGHSKEMWKIDGEIQQNGLIPKIPQNDEINQGIEPNLVHNEQNVQNLCQNQQIGQNQEKRHQNWQSDKERIDAVRKIAAEIGKRLLGGQGRVKKEQSVSIDDEYDFDFSMDQGQEAMEIGHQRTQQFPLLLPNTPSSSISTAPEPIANVSAIEEQDNEVDDDIQIVEIGQQSMGDDEEVEIKPDRRLAPSIGLHSARQQMILQAMEACSSGHTLNFSFDTRCRLVGISAEFKCNACGGQRGQIRCARKFLFCRACCPHPTCRAAKE